MKKALFVLFALLVITGIATAQNVTWTPGTWASPPGGVTPPSGGFGIDKLGAHQNGGRGCVGCHAPHSGARGNGGGYHWDPATQTFISTPVVGDSGDETLWGQDVTPVYNHAFDTGNGGAFTVTITETSPSRQITGIAYCLSCHDGNVAKGAMMTNKSYEQAAGLLPAGYGEQTIPTLLGQDGGTAGNYENDHPIGPLATAGAVYGTTYAQAYYAISGGKLVAGPSFTGSDLEQFRKNYGLPTTLGARTGAGFAVDTGMSDAAKAYVVCTTCHTPHSMYTSSASSSNPIAQLTSGIFPTYFFIAAPYNPGATVTDGKKASSATQFCRQCHFRGAGGSNEASGINIPTAF